MTDCCPLPLPYLRWDERAGRANVIGEGREGEEGGRWSERIAIGTARVDPAPI